MNQAVAGASARRELEVIGVIGFGHGVSHFFHLMLPPLFPWLMREFALNFTQVGMLMTVFFVVSGLGQAAAGFVVDRVGARRALLVGMALFALAAVTLGLAQGYAGLVAAAALAGLGNSVFHPADFTVLNRSVSAPRLGHAFSVHGLSGNLGWALAPVFMTGIALAYDWRSAAFAASAVALLAAALIVMSRDLMQEPPAHADMVETTTTFGFLGSAAVWMCFAFFFLVTMGFGILQNYAPSLLQQLYGLSLVAGASSLSVYLLGGAGGMALGGFLTTRYQSYDRLIALVLSGGALCALAIASGAIPPWSVIPLMALMGFCNGVAGPLRDMLVRRAATARFGNRAFGRVYGFVYSGLDIGFALAAPVFGPLMDRGRFALVLLGVAALQGTAVVTALRIGRR